MCQLGINLELWPPQSGLVSIIYPTTREAVSSARACVTDQTHHQTLISREFVIFIVAYALGPTHAVTKICNEQTK